MTLFALYVINLGMKESAMQSRKGMTLMEIIVVLMIVAIAATFFFSDFTTPTEKARVITIRNNLLAIYSAEKNYYNNNGSFAFAANLATINSTLALNIQDDGTYLYSCVADPTGFVCTASRNNGAASLTMTLTNVPIQISGNVNPTCVSSAHWCP